MTPTENMTTVHWSDYYDSVAQFIIATFIQVVAIIGSTYLLGDLIYKLWFRNSTAHEEAKEIIVSLKLLTVAYLVCFWLFVTTSLSFRIYVILFDGSISCWIPEFMICWFFLSRLCLEIIYLLR